jgi:hypothetical protein
MTEPNVKKQRGAVQKGQSATLRAIGLPKITDPQRDPNRQVSPDATGFYEADPLADMWNSNRTMQLNQAGKALVGWFTAPPGFVAPVQEFAIRHAVLICDMTVSRAGGFDFFYRVIEADDLADVDPIRVLSPFDPWDKNNPPERLGTDNKALGKGFIKFTPMQTPGRWDFPSPRLAATIRFDLEDQSNATLTLTQTQPAARAAERTIKNQTPALQRALIVRHRRPVPATFFNTDKPCGATWKQARDLFKPDGPLTAQIKAYFDADGSGPGNSAGRELAKSRIEQLLTFPWDRSVYERWLNALLTRDACTTKVQIGGSDDLSFRDWMAKLAAAEVARHQGEQHDPTFVAYPKAFDKLLGGAKLFAYEMAFSSMSEGKNLLPLLKGAGGVFEVTVSAKEAPAAQSGALPSDGDFTAIKESNHATFYGAYLEVKGGTGDPPKLPKSIRFISGEQLNSSDFTNAVFEVYALDAGVTFFKAGVKTPVMDPHIAPNSAADTQLMRIHVKDQVLEATFSEANLLPDWGASWGLHPPTPTSLKPIFSTHGTAVDTDFAAPDVSLRPKVSAGASVGAGIFAASGRDLTTWLKVPPPLTGAQQDVGDGRTLTAAFAKASALLSTKVLNWDIKFLLELMWAVDLAIFNGAPAIDITGHASPEYIPQYNLLLSMKRAQAVKFALEDAVGPFSDGQIVWNGDGDQRAQDAGLKESDPTGDPKERAEFLKTHPNVELKWKPFRMVELDVRGNFSIKVVTFDGHDFM